MRNFTMSRGIFGRRRGGYGYRLGTRSVVSPALIAWIVIAVAAGGATGLASLGY